VHAKNDIPAKETLIVIPRHCMITEEMGKDLPIGRKIESSGVKLHSSKHVFLMLFLLWDRKNHGVKSFFHHYYDLLPQSFCSVPFYWTPEEKKYLEGSFLIAEINRRIKGIVDDYNAICEIAPEMEKLCLLQDFQWAYTVVTTRNFGVELDNGVWTSALVPQADMLNHRRPPQAEWKYDLERDAFTVTTYVHLFFICNSFLADHLTGKSSSLSQMA
jgi:protein-histidine N-methyltransferase